MSDEIKVAIRLRPKLTEECGKRVYWGTTGNKIYLLEDLGQHGSYTFDYVFDMDKTNEEIYTVVAPLIESSIKGINATIFAYGQTASGKTHTVMGVEHDLGIIPKAIDHLFSLIEANENHKFMIRAQYFEIYNDRINDLLDKDATNMKIFENQCGTITTNCREEITPTRTSLLKIVQKGNKNRHFGETRMNEHSSRSHVIFKLIVESSCNDDETTPVMVSQLNIVDLAGSERVAQTRATGTQLVEGGYINKSLSALGRVMRQLSDKQDHINYRDSKLTRILSYSLGGNSRTIIIAAITPTSLEDSKSTLNFAKCAKTVQNKAKVNEIISDEALLKRHQKKEKVLRGQVEYYRKMYEEMYLEIAEITCGYATSESGSSKQRRRTTSFERKLKRDISPSPRALSVIQEGTSTTGLNIPEDLAVASGKVEVSKLKDDVVQLKSRNLKLEQEIQYTSETNERLHNLLDEAATKAEQFYIQKTKLYKENQELKIKLKVAEQNEELEQENQDAEAEDVKSRLLGGMKQDIHSLETIISRRPSHDSKPNEEISQLNELISNLQEQLANRDKEIKVLKQSKRNERGPEFDIDSFWAIRNAEERESELLKLRDTVDEFRHALEKERQKRKVCDCTCDTLKEILRDRDDLIRRLKEKLGHQEAARPTISSLLEQLSSLQIELTTSEESLKSKSDTIINLERKISDCSCSTLGDVAKSREVELIDKALDYVNEVVETAEYKKKLAEQTGEAKNIIVSALHHVGDVKETFSDILKTETGCHHCKNLKITVGNVQVVMEPLYIPHLTSTVKFVEHFYNNIVIGVLMKLSRESKGKRDLHECKILDNFNFLLDVLIAYLAKIIHILKEDLYSKQWEPTLGCTTCKTNIINCNILTNLINRFVYTINIKEIGKISKINMQEAYVVFDESIIILQKERECPGKSVEHNVDYETLKTKYDAVKAICSLRKNKIEELAGLIEKEGYQVENLFNKEKRTKIFMRDNPRPKIDAKKEKKSYSPDIAGTSKIFQGAVPKHLSLVPPRKHKSCKYDSDSSS